MANQYDRGGFTFNASGARRQAEEALRRRLHEQTTAGQDQAEEPRRIIEINPRPAPKPASARVLILVGSHAQTKIQTVTVMVADIFGRLRPLIDGETGTPCDFMAELGDPRDWRGDNRDKIKSAAKRAGEICGKMLARRAAP